MKKGKKKPQIRFKGFTDAWEQRELGECFTERTERSAKGELIAVTINSGVVKATELNRTDNSSEDKSNYKIVCKNDIAYNSMRMWQGASGYSPYDGILSPAYTVAIPKNNIDTVFFSYMFKCSDLIYKFQINSQGLTSDTWNLKFPAFSKIKVKVPKYVEQQKIGAYFQTLDTLITLHQRKCETLKKLKKSMLQQMFPKNGSKFPEIRFKGFTDAWEQRKLGELCSLFADGDWIEAKDQSQNGIRLVQTGNVGVTQYLDKTNNAKWITEETFNRLKCEEIFEGDILISRLPEPAGRACIMPNLGTKMITAVDCTIVRTLPEISSEYLVQYLSTDRYFKVINSFLAGGTRQRVSRSNLAEISVSLSKNEDEQQKIGAYFQTLDRLITLHQRKLETLKNLKKSMMQKMFV